MELVCPSAEYKDSYIAAVQEFQADADTTDRSQAMKQLSVDELAADFEGYVVKLNGYARGENLPAGWVPHSEFWLVDGTDYIGRTSVRHRLNDRLLKYHGHIGYDIRPSQRRKGYGTRILALALEKAKELGIERVLVTCNADNIGSRRVIEKNGGVFESEVVEPESGLAKLRFWIEAGRA